jgi:hypothetical protein
MSNKPKHSRRITVDDRTWLWRCSARGTVTLWAPDGAKHYLRPPQTSGVSDDTYRRGLRKKTSDAAITPLHVAGAIRKLQTAPAVKLDQSKNGVRVIVHLWSDGGRVVDADCQCFGERGRVHSDPRCPRIPKSSRPAP